MRVTKDERYDDDAHDDATHVTHTHLPCRCGGGLLPLLLLPLPLPPVSISIYKTLPLRQRPEWQLHNHFSLVYIMRITNSLYMYNKPSTGTAITSSDSPVVSTIRNDWHDDNKDNQNATNGVGNPANQHLLAVNYQHSNLSTQNTPPTKWTTDIENGLTLIASNGTTTRALPGIPMVR
jgi:hypothetical protein